MCIIFRPILTHKLFIHRRCKRNQCLHFSSASPLRENGNPCLFTSNFVEDMVIKFGVVNSLRKVAGKRRKGWCSCKLCEFTKASCYNKIPSTFFVPDLLWIVSPSSICLFYYFTLESSINLPFICTPIQDFIKQ